MKVTHLSPCPYSGAKHFGDHVSYCDKCEKYGRMTPQDKRVTFFILFILVIMLLTMLFSCVTSTNRFYNTLEGRTMIILDKRYVPGFTSPDKFLLKVREGYEYRWLQTSQRQYTALNIGDTLKSVLIYSNL